MRWVSEEDKDHLEQAQQHCRVGDYRNAFHKITKVLANMMRLEKEQPTPEPRIVKLSDSELRKIYPDRY